MLGESGLTRVMSARGIVRPVICFVKPQTTTCSAFLLGQAQDVDFYCTASAKFLRFHAPRRRLSLRLRWASRVPGSRFRGPYEARGRLLASPGCIGRVIGRLSPATFATGVRKLSISACL